MQKAGCLKTHVYLHESKSRLYVKKVCNKSLLHYTLITYASGNSSNIIFIWLKRFHWNNRPHLWSMQCKLSIKASWQFSYFFLLKVIIYPSLIIITVEHATDCQLCSLTYSRCSPVEAIICFLACIKGGSQQVLTNVVKIIFQPTV
jgi:hypothetical protein